MFLFLLFFVFFSPAVLSTFIVILLAQCCVDFILSIVNVLCISFWRCLMPYVYMWVNVETGVFNNNVGIT